MSKFTASNRRYNPYRDFKFRVFWEGSHMPVAGFRKALNLSTAHRKAHATAHPIREHGSGRTKYDAITLERGVTSDPEFAGWAGAGAGGSANPLTSAVRDVRIERYNEAGEPMQCYRLVRCRVAEFQGLPDLDAQANEVTIEHLKLEHEGSAEG
jgi:phage tail-like protein